MKEKTTGLLLSAVLLTMLTGCGDKTVGESIDSTFGCSKPKHKTDYVRATEEGVLDDKTRYETSETFRAEVDEKYRQQTEWTTEKKKANPVLYATVMEKKLDENIRNGEVNLKRLRQQYAEVGIALEKERKLYEQSAPTAEKYAKAYHNAEATGTWPVEISGKTFTKDQLGLFLSSLNSTRTNYKTRSEQMQQRRTYLEREVRKQDQFNMKLAQQRTALSQIRVQAKSNATRDEATAFLTEIDDLIKGEEGLVTDATYQDTDALLSQESEAAEEAANLDAILNEFK